MAREHEHDLEAYADEWGVVWVHCQSCNGFSQLWSDFQASQEQQLAQARAENERWRRRDAEWAESQAYAVTRYAEAHTLLEAISHVEPTYWDAINEVRHCLFCSRGAYQDHDSDCLWLKVCDWLAERKE